ncbi:MAG: hypothetical protein R6U10_03920 [Thermoplasmatota archaeon]
MRRGGTVLIVCAIGLLIVPSLLAPLTAAETPGEVELRFTMATDDGVVTETQRIPADRADLLLRTVERIRQHFHVLRAADTTAEREAAEQALYGEVATLDWLKVFVYLLDRIEDMVDAYITPWTKVSCLAHVLSYGHGTAHVPLHRERPFGVTRETFLGLMLRPVWWRYNSLSMTVVRKGSLLPPRIDWWDMWGRQQGIMVGFLGLHMSVIRPVMPDTHLFVGRTLFMVNKDLAW